MNKKYVVVCFKNADTFIPTVYGSGKGEIFNSYENAQRSLTRRCNASTGGRWLIAEVQR